MEISSSIADASAQLGSLQKLPMNVRLLIWEKIFFDISESPISRSENVLSILYCSRFIYEEVSWHFYSGIVHEIFIDSIYDPTCYMIARISSKRLERICKLKDSAAVRNHLFRFPHNRMKPATLHVNIRNNSDPQLTINMWLKINSIVEILAGQDLSLKIHVKLIGQWLKQGWLRSFRFE